MKFYLISSILLLVPLAFARLPAELTSKLLYDGGFAIGENFDGRYAQISYYEPGAFRTTGFYYEFRNNNSEDSVALKSEFAKEALSFAVETWPTSKEESDDWNRVQCVKKTDESLRHLIKDCWANIRLRSLTEEEKKEVQKFKDEYKVTRKPFILIHDGKEMKIKTTGLEMFYFEDELMKYTNRMHDFVVYNNGDASRKIWVLGKMDKNSFVVEALPDDEKNVNCRETEVKDMYFGECHGNIKLRRLNENDLQ